MGLPTEADSVFIPLILPGKDDFAKAAGRGKALPVKVRPLAAISRAPNVAIVVDKADIGPAVAIYISNPDICWCKVSKPRDNDANVIKL
jgi:hypothetical protein